MIICSTACFHKMTSLSGESGVWLQTRLPQTARILQNLWFGNIWNEIPYVQWNHLKSIKLAKIWMDIFLLWWGKPNPLGDVETAGRSPRNSQQKIPWEATQINPWITCCYDLCDLLCFVEIELHPLLVSENKGCLKKIKAIFCFTSKPLQKSKCGSLYQASSNHKEASRSKKRSVEFALSGPLEHEHGKHGVPAALHKVDRLRVGPFEDPERNVHGGWSYGTRSKEDSFSWDEKKKVCLRFGLKAKIECFSGLLRVLTYMLIYFVCFFCYLRGSWTQRPFWCLCLGWTRSEEQGTPLICLGWNKRKVPRRSVAPVAPEKGAIRWLALPHCTGRWIWAACCSSLASSYQWHHSNRPRQGAHGTTAKVCCMFLLYASKPRNLKKTWNLKHHEGFLESEVAMIPHLAVLSQLFMFLEAHSSKEACFLGDP